MFTCVCACVWCVCVCVCVCVCGWVGVGMWVCVGVCVCVGVHLGCGGRISEDRVEQSIGDVLVVLSTSTHLHRQYIHPQLCHLGWAKFITK